VTGRCFFPCCWGGGGGDVHSSGGVKYKIKSECTVLSPHATVQSEVTLITLRTKGEERGSIPAYEESFLLSALFDGNNEN
jgi:hypothetical protein